MARERRRARGDELGRRRAAGAPRATSDASPRRELCIDDDAENDEYIFLLCERRRAHERARARQRGEKTYPGRSLARMRSTVTGRRTDATFIEKRLRSTFIDARLARARGNRR